MKAEALVIGGGLAGAAVATLLARAGRDVVLVEREREPRHKVCGEFLSREALGSLAALGMDVAALGAACIHSVRLGNGAAVPLPFAAMSLTRRCLDGELLRVAEAAGARVLRGHSMRSLDASSNQCIAALDGQESVEASACFLATGKHDLRGWPRPAGKQNDLVAFKMYFRLAPEPAAELAGHVELYLYRGGYAGLQPVEGSDGRAANLCCLVRREELQRLGGGWDAFFSAMLSQSSQLMERLAGAEPLLAKPLALSAIPYGLVREPVPGVWCVGDQAAVIPSFTGDGMSIALHTAEVAARMYLAGETSVAYQRAITTQLRAQVELATAVSRGMVAMPALLQAAARIWPGALRVLADKTRISAEARPPDVSRALL